MLSEKEHRHFERRGNNLVYRCRLTKRQVKQGAAVRIPTLSQSAPAPAAQASSFPSSSSSSSSSPSSSVLTLHTSDVPGLKHGSQKIFPGRGVAGKGDLIVFFEVVP